MGDDREFAQKMAEARAEMARARRRHPSAQKGQPMDTVIYCPNCGAVVHAHCANTATCTWWTCPRCHSYGDSHGRTVTQENDDRR